MSLAAITQARADGLRPDLVLTVSEWADAHRMLPKKSSAEPGPWRTSRTPYLREIMDCLSSRSPVQEVVLMAGSQLGKSEALLNSLGYAIDHSPGPIIFVQPTVETGKRFSRQRIEPLINGTPRLRSKVAPSRARDSGNTVLGKEFPGGQLIITGANSAVGLRSMPAQYAFMDEIDGYPVDVDEEGSPIDLVEARQRTFARRKTVKASTPTIAGRSAIETAFEASDQRRFYVPCPDCGERQPLEFPRLVWSRLDLKPEDAVYECRACDFPIPHHLKTSLLAAGQWVPEHPEAVGRIHGYHLNALYAPIGWISWGDIARQFVRVHRNPEKFRVFVNTVLGEVWTSQGEAPEWEALMRRRESYPLGTVPEGALLLTAGVDVQKDRVVVEVVGWGRGKCSWSVDTFNLPGDTADLESGPWKQLDALLGRTFPHAHGGDMPITMLAIDSGFHTQTVYAWAKQYPMNRVIAVKGQDHGAVLVGAPTAVEITVQGRKSKRGGRVWPVAVNMAKSELYGWLKLETSVDGGAPPPGFCHFSLSHDEEFFKQLTAEQLVPHKTRKGYVRMEWELIPGRQNHALDARIYARAAAALAGLDRAREQDWARIEKGLHVETTVAPAPLAPLPRVVEPPAERPVAPKKPSFLGERRNGFLRGRR